MKIALISTYGHPLALGLRYISAFLKHHGHDVRMLFIASKQDTARASFSPKLTEALVEQVRDVDLIGFSLMTNTFHRARVLTEAIRAAGVRTPVIWGGVHPTLAPEESLGVADIVCIGEGEHPMLELAEALEGDKDPTRIEGLWFRRNGDNQAADGIVRNPVRPLDHELDLYPFPDYELANQHYVTKGDALVPARPELLRGVLTRYRAQTTRGCPNGCTFCNNTALKNLYHGHGPWVRLRSVPNVIAELEQRVAEFPGIEAINVIDDLFFIRNEESIAEFARLYAERVNLPIELDAYPTTVTPGKIEALRQLPLALISMGIQSGSEDTLHRLYERRTPLKRITQAIDLLADNKIPAEYHYIVANPFEPDASMIETLHFAARHHRPPAIVRVFPLALYPGTPLYERAVADGIIQRRHEAAYEYTYGSKLYIRADSYLTVLLRMVLALKGMGCPAGAVERFVNVATSRPIRAILDRRWFPYCAFVVYRVGHFVGRRIILQCILKPLAWLRGKGRAQPALARAEVRGYQ